MSLCVRCKKEKGWTAYNYAGYVLDRGTESFPFPTRINPTILPGEKDKDFLCSECAGMTPILCKVHGNINYSDFGFGKQPRCKGCDLQLETLQGNKIPPKFKWVLPVSKIFQKFSTSQKGWIALSDDQILHIIDENNKVFLSDDISEFIPEAGLTKDNTPVLFLYYKKRTGFECSFDFGDEELLKSAMNGSQELWLKFWANSLTEKLGVTREKAKHIHLVRLSWTTFTENIFTKKQSIFKNLFCLIDNGQFLTFPSIQVPAVEDVVCWRNPFGELIEFIFEIDGITQLLSFEETIKLQDYDFFTQVSDEFTEAKKDIRPDRYDVSNRMFCEIICFPENEKHKAILETKQDSLIATLLPDKKILKIKSGYSYNGNLIAYTDCKKIFTAKLTGEVCQIICSKIEAPSAMSSIKMSGEGLLFFTTLMDKDLPKKVHEFSCTSIGCNINGRKFKHSEQVRLEKSKINGTSELFQLRIFWEHQGKSHSIKCVAPAKLTNAIIERWETERVSVDASVKTLPQLYKEYNQCKKDNLLYILFVDIFLLNRELNSGLTLHEIADELSGMSGTELYENHKDLLKTATKKILLVSEIISNLKHKYEYLSLYYPYYVLRNESEWVSSVFGSDVAKNILEDERAKITHSYREKVRYVQGELRRILGEIERCIAPTKNYFNRDVTKSTTSSKISRHMPTVGQAAVVGIDFIVTGGMSSTLIGMFGISALGKTLGNFQENKESAQSVKTAFEELTPWWSLFMNSLSVIVYETEHFIEKDNVRCMQRDRALLDRVPKGKEDAYLFNMSQLLMKKIVREKHTGQLEVVQDSGVTIGLILKDMARIREIDMPNHVNGFIDSLNFNQRRI
jgi:hypothetical protein